MPIVTKKKAKLPGIELSAMLMDEIGMRISQGIVQNIANQKQANGAAIKKNSPGVRAQKAKEGRPPFSLIHRERRFIQKNSWKWIKQKHGRGWTITLTPGNAELAALSKSVQQKGYVGWFGVSKTTIGAIKGIIKREMEQIFRSAKARG